MSKMLLGLTLLVVAAASSFAQPCFRYDQKNSCSSYPLSDFVASVPLPGANGAPARHVDLGTSLGWLFTLNEKTAVGPAFFFSAYLNGGWHSQLGAQGRVRYWLNPNLHVDFSPGAILRDSPYPRGFAGYTAEISAGYRDWVSLAARVDRVRVYPDDHDTVLQVGIKLGSYAGMGLTAVGTVAGGIAYLLSQID
ncbi:MAG: hypothetical protein DKINENOH_00116 [bacterium]|nr:hypothetical protein [bacterium]